MSKIDIHNYEAYLLDLAEGNLPGDMQIELELFLIQHPELKTDLSELALFTLDTEEITFSGKQHLKKTEQELVSEEQFIAYIENQLPLNERTAIEKSCASNPVLSKELSLYTKTIAKADSSIVFENKESLKRKPKVIWFNFSATQFAAAASVLFLIGLFVLWPKSDDNSLNNSVSLAENKFRKDTSPLKIATSKTNTSEIHSQSNTTSKQDAVSSVNSGNDHQVTVNASQNTTTAVAHTNETIVPDKKDTLTNLANHKPVIEIIKEEKKPTLLAAATKTKIDVITESDDEYAVPAGRKKGLWAMAKQTLKNLNTVGVKSVNGTEEETSDNRTYALTLGNIKITHKGN
jgi:hypothetical protein